MAKIKPRKEKPVEPVYKTVEEIVAARDQYFHEMPMHEELVAQVRERRETLDKQIAAIDARKKLLEDQWNASNAEFLEVVKVSEEAIGTLECDLRDSIVLFYKAQDDPEKKTIADGIGVRVNKIYEYDPEKAVEYAIDHKMPGLLAIDSKAFKAHAGVHKMPFVEVIPDPVAIATKPKGTK